MDIKGTNIPVNIEQMKAEIDAMDKGKIYVVQNDGSITMYPLPKFGVIEIPCQNYKIGRPRYQITAD